MNSSGQNTTNENENTRIPYSQAWVSRPDGSFEGIEIEKWADGTESHIPGPTSKISCGSGDFRLVPRNVP